MVSPASVRLVGSSSGLQLVEFGVHCSTSPAGMGLVGASSPRGHRSMASHCRGVRGGGVHQTRNDLDGKMRSRAGQGECPNGGLTNQSSDGAARADRKEPGRAGPSRVMIYGSAAKVANAQERIAGGWAQRTPQEECG